MIEILLPYVYTIKMVEIPQIQTVYRCHPSVIRVCGAMDTKELIPITRYSASFRSVTLCHCLGIIIELSSNRGYLYGYNNGAIVYRN